MKAKTRDSSQQSQGFDSAHWCNDHPEFVSWWKRHRHSGYCELDGKSYWTEPPWAAWTCARYRAEFSSDTGSPFPTPKVNGFKIEYSAEEIESWAQSQNTPARKPFKP